MVGASDGLPDGCNVGDNDGAFVGAGEKHDSDSNSHPTPQAFPAPVH